MPDRDISWMFKLPVYISAYGEFFHPILPILHWPTVDMITTKEPLLQSIACIGSNYHSGSQSSNQQLELGLFESSLETLDRLVIDPPL